MVNASLWDIPLLVRFYYLLYHSALLFAISTQKQNRFLPSIGEHSPQAGREAFRIV